MAAANIPYLYIGWHVREKQKKSRQGAKTQRPRKEKNFAYSLPRSRDVFACSFWNSQLIKYHEIMVKNHSPLPS
ncbi:MAG: hypothetical protein ACREOI_04690, partial [bacterium]